jgi:hypothetical protein
VALKLLPPNEWDFTEVPDTELIGCCYWEYARESDFIRRTLHRYREWFVSGAEQSKESEQLFADMDGIQSIGDVSEVIVRGCSFPAEMKWQTNDPDAENYRHPDADYITGSFPAPWLTLSNAERACRARTANYGKRLISPAIERGHYHEAEDIGKYCRARAKEISAEYHRIQGENPGKSEVQLIQEGKLKPGQDITPSLFWESGSEVTVLRINWSDYTNDGLVQHFRRWVKTHRPAQIPVPSRQGRKPGDWRAHLTRLAVMRLLGAFKPSDVFNWSSEIGRLVRESKQFSRRKWVDSTKWHDARREAREIFRLMFPFLPKGEIPRSWVRRHPANSTAFPE